jgi:hypothetical protein
VYQGRKFGLSATYILKLYDISLVIFLSSMLSEKSNGAGAVREFQN